MFELYENFKCPKCNGTFTCIETLDTDITKDQITIKYSGYCDECEEYEYWVMVYQLREIKKAKKVKHIHCPVNGWDCPYYTDENHPCRCTLADPMKDCDDFATMWDEGDDYIDDDWEIDPDAELEKLMIENSDVLKRLKNF